MGSFRVFEKQGSSLSEGSLSEEFGVFANLGKKMAGSAFVHKPANFNLEYFNLLKHHEGHHDIPYFY